MAGTPTEQNAPGIPEQAADTTRRVCHRVKNDLQTILNLLILAEAKSENSDDLSEAMQKRITVVGSAYAMFADTGNPPTLESLSKEITQRCAARHGVEVSLWTDVPDTPLSLRLCTPFALWIGEIVDNCILHCRGGADIRLEISGGENTDDLWLQIADNGSGLPLNFDMETDSGLGLQLARAIAQRDLGGEMQIINKDSGLAAKITVPIPEFRRLNND